MRIWDWLRGSRMSDDVDPTLARLLSSGRTPSLDAWQLARARARVDARLGEPRSGGGLFRRLALGSIGGGSMWAGLLSAAAANKAAAAAIGLSVLVGGTVVETTGVGPAVREAVYQAVTQDQGSDAEAQTALGPAEASQGAVAVAPAETLPGNLVTHLTPQGNFELRGEIVSAEGDTLTVTTPEGDVEIDVSGADVRAAGNPADGVDLAGYAGYGVFVSGACVNPEPDPAATLADCESLAATRVEVLGRAGQGAPQTLGQPEGAGQPEGVGDASSGASEQAQVPEDAGRPDGVGQPDDAGQPDGTGQPEGAGQP